MIVDKVRGSIPALFVGAAALITQTAQAEPVRAEPTVTLSCNGVSMVTTTTTTQQPVRGLGLARARMRCCCCLRSSYRRREGRYACLRSESFNRSSAVP
jgi:hypothetical protein